MEKTEHINYWIESAISDLDVAETLLITGKNLWCLFISHLIIEKALKAYYVKNNDETPPKIHNLVNLAMKSKVNLSENQLILLDRLNVFQISARYPDYKNKINSICTDDFTNNIFKQTKELFGWLISQLK